LVKPITPLPSKSELLDFIKLSSKPPKIREIARVFGVQPKDRAALRQLLLQIATSSDTPHSRNSNSTQKGTEDLQIPELCIMAITSIDFDGIAGAKPVDQHLEKSGFCAEINLISQKRKTPILGDHILARITDASKMPATAELMRILPKHSQQSIIYGRAFKSKAKWYLESSEKGLQRPILLDVVANNTLEEGTLVKAELLRASDKYLKKAKLIDIIGHINNPESILALTISEYNLTDGFPEDVISKASIAIPAPLSTREDITDISLITIDGADAKDFDDAVFAEPLENGDWRLIVAIADVSHYVQENSIIDLEAQKRGNSVYLPSKVLPMIPENLSNGLCSLKPNEERACLAVEIFLDSSGNKKSHRFIRGLMRSVARLTYDKVQAVYEGVFDENQLMLPNGTLHHLFAVYQARKKIRHERGTLELQLDECSIKFSENNIPIEVEIRQQKEANELIEEFMILANICAAETLEKHQKICVYRIHEPPNSEKLSDFIALAKGFDIQLPETPHFSPKHFNQILAKAANDADKEMLQNAILRSQSRASYSIENAGHYGLGLQRYAHFTSPIRRYSDLLVHRSLISACNLGEDGIKHATAEQITDICHHISQTEQIAAKAERRAINRMTNIVLSGYLGTEQTARIIGVTHSGLFASILEGRAEGFVSRKSLPDDFYQMDIKKTTLSGKHLGWRFSLGQEIQVKISEISVASGNVSLSWRAGGTLHPMQKQAKSNKKSPKNLGKKLGKKLGKNQNRKLVK